MRVRYGREWLSESLKFQERELEGNGVRQVPPVRVKLIVAVGDTAPIV